MTNLIAAITWSLLVTNTQINYPTHQVPIPCPEGRLGCLVYHTKTEPDADPRTRDIVTQVRELKGIELRELSLRITNKDNFVRGFIRKESLVVTTTWKTDSVEPFEPPQMITNSFATNYMMAITNDFHKYTIDATNKWR